MHGFIFSLLGFASDYTNEGRAQNYYGYYGDGVIFGDQDITGEWYVCSYEALQFNHDGTVSDNNTSYGVNQNGTELYFGQNHEYSLVEYGNNGCYEVMWTYSPNDFGWDYTELCAMRKVSSESKYFGPINQPIIFNVVTD